jgi:hypothetical protein
MLRCRVIRKAWWQFFGEFLVQPLDGRQRHAVGVHHADVFS